MHLSFGRRSDKIPLSALGSQGLSEDMTLYISF